MFALTVNGGWGSWILGKCNVTCGKGYLNCTRECNNPTPAHGGSDCVGSYSEVHPCDEGCCPGMYVHICSIMYVCSYKCHVISFHMEFPTL